MKIHLKNWTHFDMQFVGLGVPKLAWTMLIDEPNQKQKRNKYENFYKLYNISLFHCLQVQSTRTKDWNEIKRKGKTESWNLQYTQTKYMYMYMKIRSYLVDHNIKIIIFNEFILFFFIAVLHVTA